MEVWYYRDYFVGFDHTDKVVKFSRLMPKKSPGHQAKF
jgi:hypothetical protein